MTGDGVNDAPALKQDDVGVAVGVAGSEVAKDAAAMVLTADTIAPIVKAVKKVRNIYENIKKAILFLLSGNLAGIIAVLFCSLAGLPVPFAPIHLLFINLLPDSLPAIALGLEPHSDDVMKRKPRDSKEGVFAGGMGFAIAYQGLLVTAITVASYLIGRNVLADMHHAAAIAAGEYYASMLGSSMAFLSLSMAEICHAFNMRSLHGSVFKLKNQNKWLWGAAAQSLLLTTVVVEVPLLSRAFDLAPLDLTEYAIALGLAVTVITIVEAVKLFTRMHSRKRGQ